MAALLIGALWFAAGPARSAAAPLRGNRAEVTISPQAPTKPIPRAFLGLSTEYATLAVDEKHTALYERVLAMLHVPGDGRFVLRIGGDSADHLIFDQSSARLPPWAFAATPAFVAQTARIVRDLRLRIIIDLNTVSTTARATGAWVRALARETALPTGSLLAFEIGNEPDIYNRAQWEGDLLTSNAPSHLRAAAVPPVHLPKRITPTSYVRTYRAFARALASAAPRVPLVAPALAIANHHLRWLSTLLDHQHPGLRVLSAHVYPYSACAKRGRPLHPTVQKLLSETATAGMAKTVRPALALAGREGYSLRLTEINSVTCGGVKGVSNTFATALWAPDALFELMRAGIEGVNLHARVKSINSPFYFDSQGGIQTHPLLYGMILFKRMLGAHSRLVPVGLRSSRALHLKVWAVKEGQGSRSLNTLKVLLINKARRTAAIHLRLPANRTASVERLLAQTASSTGGVTLAGQTLDAQAEWQGRERVERIRPGRAGYFLRLRGYSAALLTVNVAGRTLLAPPPLVGGPLGEPLLGYE